MQSGYPRNASAIIFGLLLTNETLLVIVNAVNLTLNRSGPNPTYSARGVKSDHFWKSKFQTPKKGPKVKLLFFMQIFR